MSASGTVSDATCTTPRELRGLWVSLLRQQWSSLVLVPTEPGISARWMVSALPELAPLYSMEPLEIFHAEGASAAETARIARDVATVGAKGGRSVITVACPIQNDALMPLVLAADAAVLVVRLGQSTVETARDLVELIGRERILGAVTADGSAGPGAGRS